jgi:hypothetical protein
VDVLDSIYGYGMQVLLEVQCSPGHHLESVRNWRGSVGIIMREGRELRRGLQPLPACFKGHCLFRFLIRPARALWVQTEELNPR